MVQAAPRDTTPDGSRLTRLWPFLFVVFLPNLGVPLAGLFQTASTPAHRAAVLAGVTLFVALYLWVAWHSDLSRAASPAPASPQTRRWHAAPVALLAALSIVIVLVDGPRWLSLLIFSSASAGGRFPLRQALRVIAVLAALTALLGWLSHDPLADLGPAAFWTGMGGILTVVVTYLRQTNRALSLAREENARLAVEAERLRFARDLHDLLGHDLARIALQSEMVEALVATAPERAAATAREMGEAARSALREVRAAVSGYRQPALAGELRGAGEILAAAGIAHRIEGQGIAVPPAAEAMLAWAVREGVTNVVKHSRARHCTVRVTRDADHAGIEVSDDGPGGMPPGPRGNGLAGLAERAAALGGQCAAEPCPGGGFRLVVTLPLASRGLATDAPAAVAGATETGYRR